MKELPTILFHELNNEIVKCAVSMITDKTHKHHELMCNSTFTFDDGLYSQYKHIRELMIVPKQKCILFVSSEFLYNGTDKQIEHITAPEAHKMAHRGVLSAYCTIKNLKELIDCGVCIGNHGATHYNFRERQHSIRDIKRIVQKEVETSSAFFKQNQIEIKSFAYPYNHQVPFYKLLLSSRGVENFYSKDRINIETLL